MAYIGKSPVIGNFVKLDAITAVNGQAAYTMQNGGSNFTDYESVNQFLVSLNGTIQAPTDSFTVSGSTLTFASNLSTGDVIDFIMVFGNSLSAGTPTDATVSTAKIVDDAVTLAKMASGTDGNIISYDASGNPVAVATGNDGQVLTSTGAGSPPAFETLPSSNPYTALSNAESGYITLVGGLIIQWGLFGTFGIASSGTVTFPTTFTSNCWTVVNGLWTNSTSAEHNALTVFRSPTTSQFTWYQHDTGQTGRVGAYIAIGK